MPSFCTSRFEQERWSPPLVAQVWEVLVQKREMNIWTNLNGAAHANSQLNQPQSVRTRARAPRQRRAILSGVRKKGWLCSKIGWRPTQKAAETSESMCVECRKKSAVAWWRMEWWWTHTGGWMIS